MVSRSLREHHLQVLKDLAKSNREMCEAIKELSIKTGEVMEDMKRHMKEMETSNKTQLSIFVNTHAQICETEKEKREYLQWQRENRNNPRQ